MTTQRVTNRKAADLIPEQKPFRNSTGSFWAVSGKDADNRTGQMPDDLASEYLGLFNWGFIDYVVYSYNTPIAWYCNRSGWNIPDQRYSVTTSGKHQSQLWRVK